ncbi:lytic polysaccharide monooxygenase [Auriscalpium vulgare]|uniref:Lytic polysaccharide monooxygenase n=1 Tax=Auriscalpium vulgare TaxID=40419 RepID=A0ACB8S4G2_9AGAM|nr:lytic polysaccharide monooxygenase [Auriscalpium vulgare]
MFCLLYILISLATLLPPVKGHGFVHFVSSNGQNYTGWNPFVDPYADPIPSRVIRKIPSDGPVSDVSNPDIACNEGGETGTSSLASASAGAPVTFQWTYAHYSADHLGPVSTYMASCDGDCSAFSAPGAKWFKLDAEGYDNGEFASQKLMANNFQWTSTIPASLAPGQYLIRHEIIALHSTGDPQYYPSCTQVNVTGGGSGVPSDASLVSIPGLYDGVQWPDIYNNFQGLTLPGPPVVQLSDGSTTDPGTASAPPSSSSVFTSSIDLPYSASQTTVSSVTPPTTTLAASSATAPTATSSPTSSSGQCTLSRKRRSFDKRHEVIGRTHH